MCSNDRIDEYIRRSDDGAMAAVRRAAEEGSEALNGLAMAFEEVSGDLGAVLPASQIKPLMQKIPLIEAKHTLAVEAMKTIKATCSTYPLFKDGKGKPITADERQGRVIINSPVYARVKLSAGALSVSMVGKHKPNGFLVFDKGESDAGLTWGWGADSLTRYHTSLNKEGTVPDGGWFECLGISVDVQAFDGGEVEAADLRIIGQGFAHWTENAGKIAIPLTHLERMPPLHSIEQTGILDAAASIKFGGAPFIQREPIFRLRSGDDKHGLVVQFPDSTKVLNQAYVLTFRLEGVMGVVPGGIN